jgi:hypothetical protein
MTALLEAIDREQPATIRGMAADVLSKAKLSHGQLIALADRMPKANPLELDRLLAAFAQSTDEAAGLKLIESLSGPELRAALSVEPIRQRLTKYGRSFRPGPKLYAKSTPSTPSNRNVWRRLYPTCRPATFAAARQFSIAPA